ncbi:GIN domain-containing protein [Rhizobium panacihumi]|uniref:GIN domain-containing protein n=1 Tax=Rhizobium panacihumi TaxID=2008450 RepID=UPI003D7AE380
MTRKLAFVATAGLVGAAVFLSLGFALAGPNWHDTAWLWIADKSTCGQKTSGREEVTLPLSSTEGFVIRMPASVHYQPGGEPRAIISGDATVLDHVRIDGGQLSLDCDPGWFSPRVDVQLSGPPIARWEVFGSGDLVLSGIDQPRLGVLIKGSGSATATGKAERVDVTITGSGDVSFEKLIARSVEVEVRGSGDVSVMAEADADVFITGSGDVELFGPAVMRRQVVKGSGSVSQRQ